MKIIFLLIAISILNFSFAQDVKNIFAFKNVIPRGNVPVIGGGKNSDPNVKPSMQEEHLPMFNYYIFVETNNGKPPVINSLIVENKMYKTTIEKVVDVPINYEYWDGSIGDSGHKQVIMITKNQKNIYKIILGEVVSNSKSKSEISIKYKVAKLNKIKTLKAIKIMPSSVVY